MLFASDLLTQMNRRRKDGQAEMPIGCCIGKRVSERYILMVVVSTKFLIPDVASGR
jgi:hypothetical protein